VDVIVDQEVTAGGPSTGASEPKRGSRPGFVSSRMLQKPHSAKIGQHWRPQIPYLLWAALIVS